MAQINVDRYEALAARGLGVKGPGALTNIEDGIFSTLELDANGPAELLPLQRLYRFAAHSNFAAVAGENTGIQLINDSNAQVVVLERIIWRQPGGATQGLAISLQRDDTSSIWSGGAGGILARALDSRVTPESLSGFARAGSRVGAIPAGYLEVAQPQALNGKLELEFPYVIAPGDALAVIANNVNAQQMMSLMFRVRDVLPSELT